MLLRSSLEQNKLDGLTRSAKGSNGVLASRKYWKTFNGTCNLFCTNRKIFCPAQHRMITLRCTNCEDY